MSEKEVRVVTAKEMVEFIMGQPDDKLIDYSQPYYSGSCGCLMVQFGKHVGIEFSTVGFSGWVCFSGTVKEVARLEDDYVYDDFGGRYFGEQVTFGQTKTYCRGAFPEFC